jgi:hypothetical protein
VLASLLAIVSDGTAEDVKATQAEATSLARPAPRPGDQAAPGGGLQSDLLVFDVNSLDVAAFGDIEVVDAH